VWEPADLLRFREAADADDWAAGWRLTLCGLRRSEVMGMHWSSEDTGYVVVDELGRPVRPEAYSDRFTELCTKAGVPVVRLHSVRHTHAASGGPGPCRRRLVARALSRGAPGHLRAPNGKRCGSTLRGTSHRGSTLSGTAYPYAGPGKQRSRAMSRPGCSSRSKHPLAHGSGVLGWALPQPCRQALCRS